MATGGTYKTRKLNFANRNKIYNRHYKYKMEGRRIRLQIGIEGDARASHLLLDLACLDAGYLAEELRAHYGFVEEENDSPDKGDHLDKKTATLRSTTTNEQRHTKQTTKRISMKKKEKDERRGRVTAKVVRTARVGTSSHERT